MADKINNPSTQAEFEAIYHDATSQDQAHFAAYFKRCSKALQERLKKEISARKLIGAGPKFATRDGDDGQEPENKGDEADSSNISDIQLAEMWQEIDLMDVTSIDSESLKVFDHQGFKPNEILKSLMVQARKNKVSKEDFKTDILMMCAISIIKGSINEHNFKKLSTEGQTEVQRLEKTYGIKRGSGRSEPANVVTISRIGATFPGKIIQLFLAGKVTARKFIGPFKSHTLPQYVRHQAFSAVIPSSLNDRTKMYLLDIITAFSVDQSICISPNKKEKPDLSNLFEKQRAFVQTTSDAEYPPEIVRKKIFSTILLDYDQLLPTARAIVKVFPEFVIVSKESFNADINATHI
nr:nucleocapsid protein [Citrus concave gum-associated virus]